MTQWLRKITIEYGRKLPGNPYGPLNPWTLTSQGNEDFRVQFAFTRTNTNHADTGRLSIYNLPVDFANAIRNGVQEANDDRASILEDVRFRNDFDARNAELRELANANFIRISAGYQDDEKIIFQGDITNLTLKSLSSNTDSITKISLGDTIIPLKFGWIHKSFGGGATLDKVLRAVVSSAGINMSQQALAFQSRNVAGVAVQEFRNGMFISGGVQVSIDDVVARYGVQWFIRNGEFFFMQRGALLDDFILRLDEGDNVLRPVSDFDGEDIKFTMLLDGDVLPGRGFRIFDRFGEATSTFGYRADTVQYVGDTHGNPWYCIVVASRINRTNWPDRPIPLTPDQAFESQNVAVP